MVYICEICRKKYMPGVISGVAQLKQFQGYTVDLRLGEFRRIAAHQYLEFVSFDSSQGQELLSQMHEAAIK